MCGQGKGPITIGGKVIVVLEDKEQCVHEEVPRPRAIKPCRPPIPFPYLLAKAKLEVKFEKFSEMLKKL